MSKIEEQVMDTFVHAGWECMTIADNSSAFDVLLSNSGTIIGVIFIYSSKDARELKKKAEQIQQAINGDAYKLVILTDGKSYETYVEGQYYGTSLTPMSYIAYSQRNRIMAYANLLWSKYEKDN